MTTIEITEDINALQTQKTALINQTAKLQKKYNAFEAKMKKAEEKQAKMNKRDNKRQARKSKVNHEKDNVKLTKKNQIQEKVIQDGVNKYNILEQKYNELLLKSNIQEEQVIQFQKDLSQRGEKVDLESYNICRDVIYSCIDKMCKVDMSVQCNLMEEEKFAHIEKATTTQSSKIDNDYYILKYFKTIDKAQNKRVKQVCYINENMDIRYRREMLAVLDTDNDIYKMICQSKFKGSVNIRMYSAKQFVLSINYYFQQKKQNIFEILDNRSKRLHRSTFDIDLDSVYKIEIDGYNSVYKIKFNGTQKAEIKLDQELKYFTSNANFNIIYN